MRPDKTKKENKIMDKTYNPHAIEQNCYATWEKNGYFSPRGQGKPYCIMLPPPNVTGSLHMGHGFQGTLMDTLIRYHRMLGEKVLWQGGTDHAGIATQMVVERLLLANNQSRHDLGRAAFIEKIWAWKEESGSRITQQLRRLGASLDWQRECFTLDETLSQAVREAFIRLYNEGLIYKGKRLVNWDPVLLTAISDLEVINQEEEGKLWYIRYPLATEKGHLLVATTRPETLFGDVAIAVHPEDERYRHLIGKSVALPLTKRLIPIIADDYVEREFGSGCLKVTPGHDFNDYRLSLRHQLEPINIFTPQAQLNHQVPAAYQGLERFAARLQVIADLENQGLLEKTEKHLLKVPRGEKSNAVIEPYLTEQWFLKMTPLAAPAIQAVQEGKIRFIPENWDKTYFQWMHNIEDWCISRQLWWGHRIPVWYDDAGQIYVGHDEADVRERYHLPAQLILTQEEDVLDTWFSSALWPFSTLGWPENTEELAAFFPTQVLVTGFDIIFFWVARMIMMSLKFIGKIPFHEIYITGLIRDAEGQKMSKSKGNVLDPIDLIDGISLEALLQKRTYGLMQPAMAQKIEKTTRQQFPEGIRSYGTDALRLTYASLASFTREIRFDLGRLEGYRNFCNKLWNAARFVLMNTENHQLNPLANPPETAVANRWIMSRLQQTIQEAHHHLAHYRFDLLTQTLYDFTWNEFCDWYVELAKISLQDAGLSTKEHEHTRYTLVSVLESLLRLLHPLIPFITEEIWQRVAPLLAKNPTTIMLEPYPQYEKAASDHAAETEMAWIQKIVMAIRTLRSELNIPPNQRFVVLLAQGTDLDKSRIVEYAALISQLARLTTIEWLKDLPPAQAASIFIDKLELFIPLEGVIDIAAEVAKIDKEITKLEKERIAVTSKLQNPDFIARAPADLVNREKARLDNIQANIQQQKEKQKRLSGKTDISSTQSDNSGLAE